MQETEAEDDRGAPALQAVGEQILDRDEDDRGGDQRLDDRWRDADHAIDAKRKGHRMREREGRDLPHQGPKMPAQQEQPDDEENVVEPLWHDVREADPDIFCEAREGASSYGTVKWDRPGSFARELECREERSVIARAGDAEYGCAEAFGRCKGHACGARRGGCGENQGRDARDFG